MERRRTQGMRHYHEQVTFESNAQGSGKEVEYRPANGQRHAKSDNPERDKDGNPPNDSKGPCGPLTPASTQIERAMVH